MRNAQFLGSNSAFIFGTAGAFFTADGGPMQRVPVPESIAGGVQGPAGEFWFPGTTVIHRRLPSGAFLTLGYPDSTNRVLSRSADGGVWSWGSTTAFLFEEPGWLMALVPPCSGIAEFEPIGRTALMSCSEFPAMTQRVFEVSPSAMPREVFVVDGGQGLLRARSAESALLLFGSTQTVLQLQLDGGATPFNRPETQTVFFSSNGQHVLMQGSTTAWRFSSGSWLTATAIPAGREFDRFDLAMPAGLLSGPSELYFFGTASSWPTISTQVPAADRTLVQSVTPFQGAGPLPRFLIGDGVYELAADGGLSALVTLSAGQRGIAGTRDGGFIALNGSGLLSRWDRTSSLVTAPVSIFQVNGVAVASDDSALLASVNQLYRLPPGSLSPQALDAGNGVRGFMSVNTTPTGSVLAATQTQVFDVGPSTVTEIPPPPGGWLGNIESACATTDATFVKTFVDLWIRQGGQWRRTSPGVARLACSASRAAGIGTSNFEVLSDGGTRVLEALPLSASEVRAFYGADGRLWVGAPAGEVLFHP